jgi:predicted DNA-binding ribbon-helix-helix protein
MSVAAERTVDTPSVDARLLPRFRVLTIEGVRRAFKLEPVYWSALSVLAARRRRTLAAEVVERLKSAPPGTNQSAFLRASVAGDLYDSWQVQQARTSTVGWANVVDAIAEPAFAATVGGRLTAINPPMLALLRARGLPFKGDASDISLELAPGALTLLNNGRRAEPVVCSAGFRIAGHRVSCRVRVVPSRSGPADSGGSLLIGFSAPP